MYTDNSLEPKFEKRLQEELFKAAQGKRIITVSQKPMDFGRNICVGDIGRSHHSLFTQALIGVKAAKTKYIALAEHDCMYTPEHFNWRPTNDRIFWYNVNHWFVQWGGSRSGQYSYFRRKPMSQLICTRKMFIRAVEEKISMLESGFEIRKGQPGACEPGVCDNRKAFVSAKEKWIADKAALAATKDVGKESKWTAKAFRTVLPNLDIRHGGNFSGGRKTSEVADTLPYWGNFIDYMDL